MINTDLLIPENRRAKPNAIVDFPSPARVLVTWMTLLLLGWNP